MKRGLPLYDSSVDITCTIDASEVPERLALLERMRAALKTLDRTDDGMLLHFAPNADTEADLRAFAVDEKRCCQFWGFAVDATDNELTLQWDAPPDAQHLIERIATAMQGDEPITALSGLL